MVRQDVLFEARKRIVADIEALGLLDKVEDNLHAVPFGDRSHVPIEPWLTDQWYVDNVESQVWVPYPGDSGLTHFVIDTSRNGQGRWIPPSDLPPARSSTCASNMKAVLLYS